MSLSELVVRLDRLTLEDLPRVGGKNASLGEMLGQLGQAGIRVPGGFALTVQAFHQMLAQGSMGEAIYRRLDQLDVTDTQSLATTALAIREQILQTPLPAEVREAVRDAYAAMGCEYGDGRVDVAVRSSATAEDLPTASFAGQQETFSQRSWD